MPAHPRVLFIVTEDWYFWSHRVDLAARALKAGYDVALGARYGEFRKRIEAKQIRCFSLPLERSLRYPWRDFRCLVALWLLIRAERPAIVHLVALKPMLLSALAALLLPRVTFVHAVTGLGHLFTSRESTASRLRKWLIMVLRWLLGRQNAWVIVQNRDDADELERYGIGHRSRTRLIAGSGVDTAQFYPAPSREEETPLVVMPARLLRDKGIWEFVGAADQILNLGIKVRFVLVGGLDSDNPAAVNKSEIEQQLRPGIEWWGAQTDMVTVYQRAAIVCLPSHREGLPKALLEAAACGRALIATDVPGCREICRDQITGLLVPPHDVNALSKSILSLLQDPQRRQALGAMARRVVEAEYSIETVATQTLALYQQLVERGDTAHRARGIR